MTAGGLLYSAVLSSVENEVRAIGFAVSRLVELLAISYVHKIDRRRMPIWSKLRLKSRVPQGRALCMSRGSSVEVPTRSHGTIERTDDTTQTSVHSP